MDNQLPPDAQPNPAATAASAGKPIDDKTVRYIASLFKEGKDSAFIVANLVEHGYDYQQSYDVVSAIDMKIHAHQVAQEKKGAPGALIFGIVVFVIGVAITASGSGVIAYGAIIVGAINIIRGIASYV